MPAKKPLNQHKKPLIVSCSIAQKEAIDKALSYIAPQRRSDHLKELIFKAIALANTSYSEDDSYNHGTRTSFQISCTPQQYQKINDYCDKYLPPKKRSRWIVNLILS